MEKHERAGERGERRSEARSVPEKYTSVELWSGALAPAYVFRIRDLSPTGMGILIKEESEVIKELKVGGEIILAYRTSNREEAPRNLRTRIMHVTKKDEGSLKGHYLVGLCILEGNVLNE